MIPYTNYASYNAVRDPATGVNVAKNTLLRITPSNMGGEVFGCIRAWARYRRCSRLASWRSCSTRARCSIRSRARRPGQANLLETLVPALNAFYQATVAMGVAHDTTTFTMSDFSRTWKPNGGGTDHAWGGHHFVIGGSVLGNKFYGTFPDLKLGAASLDDSGNQGRWIPTITLDQYGATLAKWFGASAADIAQVFPNVSRFTTADLGFMA